MRGLNRLLEWSLYILIFTLPFSKTMVEICAIAAIVCWVLKKFASGRQGLKLVKTDLNLPLFLFYIISFLSIFWSTHPDISIKAFIRKLSEYVVLYFIVAETVNERRIVRNIVRALAAAAVIVCLDGLFQKFTGYDFIRGYPMFNFYRVSAAFKFPNGLSAWLLVVTFPFISLLLFYKKTKKLTTANAILAVLLVCCLILTHTRGAYVSFILVLGLLLFLKSRKICIIFVVLVVALILFLPENLKYYMGLSGLFDSGSSPHRLRMWTTAWKMFMERPLLGQGLNTFMANYERFKSPLEEGIWYAHNCYLQIAAEIGLFGLLSFLWMVARVVITSLKSWRLIDDEFLRYAYLGLFCGLLAFLLHIGVEMSLYSLRLAVLFYFSLGFLMGIKKIGLNHGKIQT